MDTVDNFRFSVTVPYKRRYSMFCAKRYRE